MGYGTRNIPISSHTEGCIFLWAGIMKQLTLVRHAKSSWKYPELSDYDRPLNKRGKRDLPAMASRVSENNLVPDLILSSGARRALLTATAISNQLELGSDQPVILAELYAAYPETLLLILQNQPDSLQHIMLVGHNPGLEMLASLLCGEQIDHLPTAAVAHLHLSITEWHELSESCATLTLFDYPKKHRT